MQCYSAPKRKELECETGPCMSQLMVQIGSFSSERTSLHTGVSEITQASLWDFQTPGSHMTISCQQEMERKDERISLHKTGCKISQKSPQVSACIRLASINQRVSLSKVHLRQKWDDHNWLKSGSTPRHESAFFMPSQMTCGSIWRHFSSLNLSTGVATIC